MTTPNISPSAIINTGLIIIFLSIICIAFFFYKDNKQSSWIEQYPELTDEIQLRDAMKKSPSVYLLKNMVVTGEPCHDYLGILRNQYICISYKEKIYRTGAKSRKDWFLSSTHEEKSKQLILFNDILIEPSDYNPYSTYIKLAQNVLPEYEDNVADPQNSTYTYYPQGAGDTIGNIKYEISGIPVGSKISCIAEVGEKQIRLMGYKDNNLPAISGDSDPSHLSYELDESTSGMAAGGIFLLVTGIVTVVFGSIQKLFH